MLAFVLSTPPEHAATTTAHTRAGPTMAGHRHLGPRPGSSCVCATAVCSRAVGRLPPVRTSRAPAVGLLFSRGSPICCSWCAQLRCEMTGIGQGGHLLRRRELDLARRSCHLGTRWWCHPCRRAQPCSESRDCAVTVAREHLAVGDGHRPIIGGYVSMPPHP